MIAISAISGTLRIVVLPVAKSAAAISLRAEFFAPETFTSPCRRAPPTMRNLVFMGVLSACLRVILRARVVSS
ncbi:unannotated protein [freshwater metagenome]|uniref:Unannotated protein n=1 Tax=freshwater metagenome TaxID=449393 RepID=A0A6J7VDM1_9ZZZZ